MAFGNINYSLESPILYQHLIHLNFKELKDTVLYITYKEKTNQDSNKYRACSQIIVVQKKRII